MYSNAASAVFLFIVTALVYLKTMCPTVGFTDSGELSSVLATLGIGHPTGYPFFAVLGRFMVSIPVPARVILRVNIYNALLVSLSVSIFYLTTRILFSFLQSKKTNDRRVEQVVALCAALVYGFASTMWSQSTAIEVYALHIVFLNLIFYTLIRGIHTQDLMSASRWLMLCAFLTGLSFGNHMTTVLLIPGVVYYFFAKIEMQPYFLKKAGTIVFFFLLGLSIYLYLPLRASHFPLMDWGHPATFERLFWHVSGRQFRVWMFKGLEVAEKQFAWYINDLPNEFHWILLPFIFLGAAALFRNRRKFFIFLILLILGNLVYAVNYDIFDIDSYFLLSFFALGIFCAIGLVAAAGWLVQKRGWKPSAAGLLLMFFPAAQVQHNYSRVDQSSNFLPDDFTQSIMRSLPPHALVFSGLWDYFVSPSIYYRYIEHQRPDITILDYQLLKNRSWYFVQMQRTCPWLLERCRSSIDAFLLELDKFEHDRQFDPAVIQERWKEMLGDFVFKSLPDHPLFIDGRIGGDFPVSVQSMPYGMLIRLSLPQECLHYRPITASIRPWNPDDIIVKDFEDYRALMYYGTVRWLQAHPQTEPFIR
jgi:Protein of unknown function (DUF2723)